VDTTATIRWPARGQRIDPATARYGPSNDWAELGQVERDSRAASEDIAHQQETLRNLVRHGENTTEALRSIGILEHTHLVLSSLRDQLDEELAALD
jgi:hypothetical protein